MLANANTDYQTFITGFAVFILLLVVQLVLWRVLLAVKGRIPKQMALVFFIFGAIPAFLLLVLPLNTAGLVFALSAAYLMSFPAVQARSPTLVILDHLFRNRRQGMDREQIETVLNQTGLVSHRIADLKNDGLIKGQQGELSGAGLFLGRMFFVYRRVLGLQKGRG